MATEHATDEDEQRNGWVQEAVDLVSAFFESVPTADARRLRRLLKDAWFPEPVIDAAIVKALALRAESRHTPESERAEPTRGLGGRVPEASPPENKEGPPDDEGGWQGREAKRRRGRPAVPRPPIGWQAVAQFAEETARQQAVAVARFQALLDSLAGCKGDSPEENQSLARTVNGLGLRLGVDLLVDGVAVNVRWHNRQFEAQATSGGKSPRTSAGFPHFTAKPSPRGDLADLSTWVVRVHGEACDPSKPIEKS